MPKLDNMQSVPFTQSQMFALVNDVAKYHEFLPYCTACTVFDQTANTLDAELIFNFSVKTYKLKTRNTMYPDTLIEVDNVVGPFNKMQAKWYFIDRGASSEIKFVIDYELKPGLLYKIIEEQIPSLMQRVVDAFIDRAFCIYPILNNLAK